MGQFALSLTPAHAYLKLTSSIYPPESMIYKPKRVLKNLIMEHKEKFKGKHFASMKTEGNAGVKRQRCFYHL